MYIRDSISYHIFMGNYEELKEALRAFGRPTRVILQLWDVQNRGKLKLLIADVVRLFHNYLASVMTLVGHTRVFTIEDYKDTEFWNEYRKRVEKQFDDSPLHHFVQKLRNYMLHKGTPATIATLDLKKGFDNSIMLDVDKLRSWDGWDEKSEKYLGTLGKTIKLDKIINDYGSLVIEFYKWYDGRQGELYRKRWSKK